MPIVDSTRSSLSFQFLVSASFLLLLAIAPAAGAVSAPASNGSDLQWLHVDGPSIVREDGAIMILRGANVPSAHLSWNRNFEAYVLFDLSKGDAS